LESKYEFGRLHTPATFRAKLPDDIQFDFIDGPFKSDAAAGIDKIVWAIFGNMVSQPVVRGSDGVDAVIFPEGVVRRPKFVSHPAVRRSLQSTNLHTPATFRAKLPDDIQFGVANKFGSGK
jgi:hypothetical protein